MTFDESASSPSFFQRAKSERNLREQSLLADWIAAELVPPAARVFIISGSTAWRTAETILRNVPAVQMVTNSIPVAMAFMELNEKGALAPNVELDISGGKVRAVTGAVSGKYAAPKGSILIYSPHGLTPAGLCGNRDVDEIIRLLKLHKDVILPVSWSKFGREGASMIKHFGHWKQVRCRVVMTERPLPELRVPEEIVSVANDVMAAMQRTMGERVTFHRVPVGENHG